MNKKRIFALMAALSILASNAAFAEYDPDKVIDPSATLVTTSVTEDMPAVVNGATVDGVITEDVNGITMFPLRSVMENLGYTVTWNGESRSIDLTKGAQFITMTLDTDNYAFSRRAPQQLGACPTLVGDSTYVPLSFINEIIGGYYAENEDGTFKIVNPAIVTVSEINESSITVEDSYLGTVVVHISEETQIVKGNDRRIYGIDDINVGDTLAIEYSPAMAQSLPPQTTAVKIILPLEREEIVSEEAQEVEFSGIITEIVDNEVTVGDLATDAKAVKLIVSDETVITKGLEKRIYKLDDLAVGMEIKGTHSPAATMSIPPQAAALSIEILSDTISK